MGKGGLPEITDRYINTIEEDINDWKFEGEQPSESIVWIGNWYKINIHWKIIWQNDLPLKSIHRKWIRSPIVVITTKNKDTEWNIHTKKKETRIDRLMEKHFGHYIEGYSETKLWKNEKYIVVPKNSNWKNMSINNLKYVSEKEYKLMGTKKNLLIQLIPFLNGKSDDEIATLLSINRARVNKIKSKLKNEGKIWNNILNKLIISYKTYQIYVSLLECKWLKSNLDIAKKLRPESNFKDKTEQNSLTDKVSRVRNKLASEWLIEKYNTYQKHINIKDVRDELAKALLENSAAEKWKKKTHEEIAKAFGLEKGQVDNFSRQRKKQ